MIGTGKEEPDRDGVQALLSLLAPHNLSSITETVAGKDHSLDTLLCAFFQAYIRTHEETFFERFYRITYPRFLGFARKRLDNQTVLGEPEELVAEVYNVLLQRYTEKVPSMEENFLLIGFGTIRNLIHAKLREGRRKTIKIPDTQDQCSEDKGPLMEMIQKEDDHRRDLCKAKLQNLLFNHHSSLKEEERSVLTDYYIKKASVKDISAKSNKSTNSVYKLLYRTQSKIHKIMRSLGYFPDPGEDSP